MMKEKTVSLTEVESVFHEAWSPQEFE
jgi:hypothetical protein